jgi:methylated-DNA-protein-cysteine methyltransferase-like protein
MLTETLQEEIWQWVAAVPPGKVASYGQIAALAGHPRHSRYVGKVLRELPPGSTLPWHRILRASGELAFAPGSAAFREQRERLALEGVTVRGQRVDLARFRWEP